MKISIRTPEREAIKLRRELVQGGETIRGLLFKAIEAATVSVGGPSAYAEALAAAGMTGQTFDVMSKYSMEDFLRLEEAAAECMTDLAFEDAIHLVGEKAVETFFDSIAGRTMALLAGKDPTRLLTAVPNGYEFLVSYGERSWRRTGPDSGVFSFTGELLGPVHTCGIFDTALRMAHDVDAGLELREKSAVDFDLVITW